MLRVTNAYTKIINDENVQYKIRASDKEPFKFDRTLQTILDQIKMRNELDELNNH